MDLDFQQIIRLLAPRQGTDLIWDIMLYGVFIFGTITMFMQSDKTLLPTLMMGGVVLISVIAKLQVIPPWNILSMLLNAVMAIFPGMVAAITKAPKSRPTALLTALLGSVYMVTYLLFVQR